MPCNPCCEEVPAMASYIAEAESSASCCDFCTIYCCFGLTLFALCLMSLPPFALASIQQKKITMVYARYGTSCPTAVLTTHSLPPIKRSGPGGPCRFSSYRSWGSCMSVSFFLLVWVQCIPHQEWLDCATKKLRAKHQRPRFPLQTRSCSPTKHSLAALPCDHGRSGHLSCSNALATVSRAAPAVFCPWQAATSFPATDPSRPMAFQLAVLHILQPRLSQKPHRPLQWSIWYRIIVSRSARNGTRNGPWSTSCNCFPCCEIVSLAAKFFP